MSWDRKKCRNVIYFMTAANTSKDHCLFFFFVIILHSLTFSCLSTSSLLPFHKYYFAECNFYLCFYYSSFFVSFQSAFQLPVFMVFSDYHLLMILSLFLVKFFIFFKKWEGLCFLCMQCGVWSSFLAEVHVHLMNLLC